MVYIHFISNTNMSTKESKDSKESNESKTSEAERNIVRAIDQGDSESAFDLLMTNPETGQRMDYAESRMRWG